MMLEELQARKSGTGAENKAVTHKTFMNLRGPEALKDSVVTSLRIPYATTSGVEDFARHFNRPPDRLGPRHIREYQAQLFQKRKLSSGSVTYRLAALRFSISR